jgi:hypothetical protein
MKGGEGMKQSYFTSVAELFPGCWDVRKFSFETVGTRDKSAHFYKKDCFKCLPPHNITA